MVDHSPLVFLSREWLLTVGAPSPAEKLSPAGLRRSSKCHTCCPLSSFWVSLSTHPQVIQGRTALGWGPFCPPGQ